MFKNIERKTISNPLNLPDDVLKKGKDIHTNLSFFEFGIEDERKSPLQMFDEGIVWLESLNMKEENEFNWRAWKVLGQKNLKRRQVEDGDHDVLVLDELRAGIHDLLDCPEDLIRTWKRYEASLHLSD